MEKRWVLNPKVDENKVEQLAAQLDIDASLAQILVQRKFETFDQTRDFFRPQIAQLHNPFLMKDMTCAIDRIEKAIAEQEQILIYGDYDVDGTTAVALCYQFFAAFTSKIDFYIPDRNLEGYGISTAGIDFAKSAGFGLIIALDCGIRSLDKVSYAKSLGIDFIVADHHLPGDELPAAVAVLDPKRKDCDYPFKELSGCGIGFKLAQAFCIRKKLPDSEYLNYLDLCMVSIAADIVPIVDENRILAYHGLLKLNSIPSLGLKSLMEASKKTANYTITDVVFLLAPRINAAGRMKHAKEVVKMLISTDEVQANQQSQWVDDQNTVRKDLDKRTAEEALTQIRTQPALVNRKSTVLYSEKWNKGVIGIVASRLTETYYRPTIVLAKSNGNLTGSARSVAGYDLYEALVQCSDLLLQFGGHKFAAGLTLSEENLSAFIEKFESVVDRTIDSALLVPEIKIDSVIDFSRINRKFFSILDQMEPFGPQNMSPVFQTDQVYIESYPEKLRENHLKLRLKQQNSSIFEAVGFGLADFHTLLKPGQPFSVCYTIDRNVWKNEATLQLNLKDIRLGP